MIEDKNKKELLVGDWVVLGHPYTPCVCQVKKMPRGVFPDSHCESIHGDWGKSCVKLNFSIDDEFYKHPFVYKEVKYFVLGYGLMQVNDVWVDSVLYTNHIGKVFTREKKDFIKKFKLED